MEFKVISNEIYVEGDAVVVSYFAGDKYYHDCANELVSELKGRQVNHMICQYEPKEGESWPDLCKVKIYFIQFAISKLECPVFWVDIDTNFAGSPQSLLSIKGSDLGFYLRNFHYFPKFDSFKFSRLFHPGYVFYDCNEKVLNFLDEMIAIADATIEPATDDYVLHEALKRFEGKLSFQIFSPETIATSIERACDSTIFVHGDSGNVTRYRGNVVQHKSAIQRTEVQVQVLEKVVQDLIKKGKFHDAIVICQHILSVDEENIFAHVRLLRMYRRIKNEKSLKKQLQFGKKKTSLRLDTFIFDFERAVKFGTETQAKSILKEAEAYKDCEIVNHLKSRYAIADLDWRAKKRRFTTRKRVKVWWWRKPSPGNWGDIINPYIVEKLSGIPPIYDSTKANLLAIGSVVGWAESGSTVWGSGSPRRDICINANATYKAVRGPITRELVLNAGGECPEVYGDPALLLPLIYSKKKDPHSSRKNKIGLILHHNHDVNSLNVSKDVKVIDIHRVLYHEIEEFIDEVCSCELILSTSLHGIIVSHAYGIPARWCTLSGESVKSVPGDNMKFADYFASVGIVDQIEPIDLSSISKISADLDCSGGVVPNRSDLGLIQRGLLDAAPFFVEKSILKNVVKSTKRELA
ncbi:polysaccharide pyruvyl transferase family protein [Pseudovibrio brasiliensis]|nr:polysaccharide pyruvyl transferase family protein [Pseudovibrio brasiliensis]